MKNPPFSPRRLRDRTTLLSVSMWLVICLLRASAVPEPPPDPPLLGNVPEPAAWTIDVQHKKPRPALPADPKDAALRKRLMNSYPLLLREAVEKVGSNWHRVKFYDNQSKDEVWVSHGMIAYHFQNFAPDKVATAPANAAYSPVKSAFGPDFPELSWINVKTFVGTVTYEGMQCHHYVTTDAKPLSGGDELIPASKTAALSAWVDAKSRLPIAIESDDMVKKYSYRAGPAEIQPVGLFADALKGAAVGARTGAQ